MNRSVLITGANRGIGLEFTRQYLARGGTVFAGCRNPCDAKELASLAGQSEGLCHVVKLDVTNEADISAVREAVARVTDRLDILINNAGIFAEGEAGLPRVDAKKMLRVLHVNAVAPVVLARTFQSLLQKAKSARVINLVSGGAMVSGKDGVVGVGQWTGRGLCGSQYSYGGSKAALNFFIQHMAADLEAGGVIVIGMGPGFVRTDMTKGSSVRPPLSPEESVRGMIGVIEKLTLAETGRFFNYDGKESKWTLAD